MISKPQERTPKELYHFVCSKAMGDDPDSLVIRANIIQCLEKMTGQYFKDTDDFHKKMQLFLSGKKYTARHLRQARKKKGWRQIQLAGFLGVNQAFVAQMENGHKPLIAKALAFIEEMEIKAVATQPFKMQKGNIYNATNNEVAVPQNGGQ